MRSTNSQSRMTTAELLVLGGLTFMLGFTSVGIPHWERAFSDVCHLATIAAYITVAIFWVTPFLGANGIVAERWTAAFFLAGMPVVYVLAWYQLGSPEALRSALWLELLGVPIYVALAILGLVRSPWYLVAGVILHGLAWDSWHFFGPRPYVPEWYALGCMVFDLCFGIYLALRLPPRWNVTVAPVAFGSPA